MKHHLTSDAGHRIRLVRESAGLSQTQFPKALIHARQAFVANNALATAIRGFEHFSTEASLKGLLKLLAGTLAQGLPEGQVVMKDIDAAKLINCLIDGIESSKDSKAGSRTKDVPAESKRRVLEEIYGISTYKPSSQGE